MVHVCWVHRVRIIVFHVFLLLFCYRKTAKVTWVWPCSSITQHDRASTQQRRKKSRAPSRRNLRQVWPQLDPRARRVEKMSLGARATAVASRDASFTLLLHSMPSKRVLFANILRCTLFVWADLTYKPWLKVLLAGLV